MKPAYPIWLDVRPSGYPVFNVQRPYGGADGDMHLAEGGVREVRPLGRAVHRPGPARQRHGEDFRLPAMGEPFGRIRASSRAAR